MHFLNSSSNSRIIAGAVAVICTVFGGCALTAHIISQAAGSKYNPYEMFGNPKENRIGWQYRDILIGNENSSEWGDRLHVWKQQLKMQADSKNKKTTTKSPFGPTEGHTLHKAFNNGGSTQVTIADLQKICKRAYLKTSWTDGMKEAKSKKRGKKTHDQDSNSSVLYWWDVYEYCSKKDAALPSTWHTSASP